MLKPIALALLLASAIAFSPTGDEARAEDQWHTGLSLIGEPALPPDFKRFPYVNPDAPKGGSVTMADVGAYDTLNVLPPGGNPPQLLGLIYDTLLVASLDEPASAYGLLAEAVSFPDDRSSVTYRLRKEAKFSDGTPVTPEDVIWSFEKAKEIAPLYSKYYQNVVKVEQTSDHDVTFRFDVKNNRELPFIVAEFAVMPKHWWTGKNAMGQVRDISKGTLEPPIGSGPYFIKGLDPGRSITYVRRPDYWGKDLPVSVGYWNLDQIRYVSYGDPTVAFEALKAGDVDFWIESSAKNWATGYSFKGIDSGAVKKELIPEKLDQGMQGFAFNTRRSKFSDPRVREALGLAFDFEWSNKNLFFGQYTRCDSYFSNSDFAAKGLPSGAELEILNSVKDQVPPEVFSTEFKNPVNTSDADLRQHSLQAIKLLKDAGWSIKNGQLTNDKTGEPMVIEFLEDTEAWDRVITPYAQNLKRLGVKTSTRLVDASQYQQRLTSFDFDVIVNRFGESESPGNEQRDLWGSAAADVQGSGNYMGIKSPAIDKLIDRVIMAKDRDDLIAATRALDRVLLWGHYLVPHWYLAGVRVAYWDQYRRPMPGPQRGIGFPQVWWADAEAAAKIKVAKTQ